MWNPDEAGWRAMPKSLAVAYESRFKRINKIAFWLVVPVATFVIKVFV